MTAREQARKAACEKYFVSSKNPIDIADKASDIWEPITRELYEFMQYVPVHSQHFLDVRKRAREALGQ